MVEDSRSESSTRDEQSKTARKVEKTQYPTLDGTVTLHTGYDTGGGRVYAGDKSLYVGFNEVEVEDWNTKDGFAHIKLYDDGKLVGGIDMMSPLARRFGVECSHTPVDVSGL